MPDLPKKKYIVDLSAEEREQLLQLIRRGKNSSRKVTRARILLKANDGLTDDQIAAALDCGVATVERTRKRFVAAGLGALDERPRPGARPKLTGKQQAHIIALACSNAPEGHTHWTMRLLAGKVVELGFSESFSRESVRRLNEKNELKPWRRQQWCIPEVDAQFVALMEDVLDLYKEPYDEKRPKVNFDETSKQLIEEVRLPLPPLPGRAERFDYEYKRNGTRNLFLFCEPQAGWRHIDVTARRTKRDFAHQMKWLVDERYPGAEVIRIVMDNLNTHKWASLYEAFEPAEARRILRKLEFHYTPRHASWLNMAEIELSVLMRQCLDRRIPDEETLKREVKAYEDRRNEARAGIDWQFTCKDARVKLHRLYPSISE
ncbi:MAG TPA: IS630 family transposase [Blastocatellia bacterium]|nr:IS630 family transposase [Blastocatellia bacterium]